MRPRFIYKQIFISSKYEPTKNKFILIHKYKNKRPHQTYAKGTGRASSLSKKKKTVNIEPKEKKLKKVYNQPSLE